VRSTTNEAYTLAGVDVNLASAVKKSIAKQARSTFRPGVMSSGFFGSMFKLEGYTTPILVSSTDGVGTKVKIAAVLDKNNVVGMDIVNHCVNDILCCGAEPLFFLDYIAMDKIIPKRVEAIVAGITQACHETGCSLIGGETAEMPGVYSQTSYDLAGFIVGVVEENNIIDGSSIVQGDIILGLPSSGLHTNGYSLVRKIFEIDTNPSCLHDFRSQLGESLGEALLQIHHAYYPQIKPVLPATKGIAHITGGGFIGNIPRTLPQGLAAHLNKASWAIPPLFKLIQERGNIKETEMYQVFNMGIGMTIICSPQQVTQIIAILPQAKIIGEIIKTEDKKRVTID